MKFPNKYALMIVTILALITACSKEEKSTVSDIANQAKKTTPSITDYLPDGTVAFVVVDIASPAFLREQELMHSVGGASNFFQKTLNSLHTSSVNAGKEFSQVAIKVMESAELYPKYPKKSKLKEALFFLSSDSKKESFHFTSIASTSEEIDTASIIKIFEETLKNSTLKFEKGSYKNNSTITITTDNIEELKKINIEKLYLLVNRKTVALTTSLDLLDSFLDNKPTSYHKNISTKEHYQKAMEGISANLKDSYALGFVDIDSLGQMKLLEGEPSLPISAIAYSRSANKTITDSLSIPFLPKTDEQKKVLVTLNENNSSKAIEELPAKLTSLLSVNKNIIKALFELSSKATDDKDIQAISNFKPEIESINSLSLAVKTQGAGSLFPELMLIIDSSNAQSLMDRLKAELNNPAVSGGFLSQLQEKQIDSAKVLYSVSPFGAGVFLTVVNSYLFVSSSESLLTESLSLAKNKGERFSNELKSLTNNKNNLLLAFNDFSRLATLIEQTQANMSMFTGGKNPVETSDIEALKKMGKFIATLNFEKGIIKGNFSYNFAQ